MKVVLIMRDKRKGGVSIEGIFKNLQAEGNTEIKYYLWHYDTGKSLWTNVKSINKLKADIFHLTGDINYLIIFLVRKLAVLTIHDIGRYKELKGIKKVLYGWIWLKVPVFRANQVAVVSKFTRDDLVRLMPKAAGKIKVISNGINPLYQYRPNPFNAVRPRILQVGTAPHKNLEIVIKGLKDIISTLVIIGPLQKRDLELLAIHDVQYENYVDLDTHALVEQYQRCDIVVFISSHEGFGMPILEAQAVGRAVIASRAASIPEVAGNGVFYLNNHLDPGELNSAIRQVMSNELLREKIIQAGLQNVQQYSFDRMAHQYLALYTEVLAS